MRKKGGLEALVQVEIFGSSFGKPQRAGSRNSEIPGISAHVIDRRSKKLSAKGCWRMRPVKTCITKLLYVAILIGGYFFGVVYTEARASGIATENSESLTQSIYLADAKRESAFFVSAVKNSLPCTMSTRCHSASCMSVFLTECVLVFPPLQPNTGIAAVSLLRSGSDLPPPIGPPRWKS